MTKSLDRKTPDCSVDDNAEPSVCDRRSGRFTLPAVVEIDDAIKLHKKMQKSAAREVDIDIDAGKVEAIDTVILQLLLSFVREIRGSGNRVNWLFPSEPLLKAAELIGLGIELGLEKSHATS